MNDIAYTEWTKPECPTCGPAYQVKEIGGGSITFRYTEWTCGRCGSIWGENHAKPGFIFRVREEIARHS